MIPTSEIHFIKGIPLDTSYQNTITFSSPSEQASYFLGQSSKALSNYTVIKDGELKVSGDIGSWYDYNYIMFKNSNFSNKWFYGFIIGQPEYVNPNVSIIKYQIDVMQTWFFDWEFLNCLIEREHVEQDILYQNLEEEGLELGEYVYNLELPIDFTDSLGEKSVVFMFSEDVSHIEIGGETIDFPVNLNPPGIYGGQYICYYWINVLYTSENIQPITNFIQSLANYSKLNALVEVYIFFGNVISDMKNTPSQLPIYQKDIVLPTSFEGYIPKNKKLLQYPYYYLELNGWGQTQQVKPEFLPENPKIALVLPMKASGSSFVWCPGYLGIPYCFDSGVSSPPLPLYGYSKDSSINEFMSVRNSRNQTANAAYQNMIIGSISSGLKGLSGFTGGGGNDGDFTGISSVFQGGASVYGKIQNYKQTLAAMEASGADARNKPLELANQNAVPELNYLINFNTPYIMSKCITKEMAERIDGYFTMYGYKVNDLRIPNIYTRPNYNFLKLTTCNLKPNKINASDLDEIKQILTNGITFWHNPNIVGDYSVDNSPVSRFSDTETYYRYKEVSL